VVESPSCIATRLAALGLACAALFPTTGVARTLRVGISGTEPFLIEQQGRITGISADVWREVALEQSRDDPLVPHPSMAANLLAAALSSIGVLLVSLFVVGNLIWRAERRRNSAQFPGSTSRPYLHLHGVGNGMWLAIVTLSTVGQGDRAPLTPTGWVIAGVWMMITLLEFSSITAGLASSFTLALARIPGDGIRSSEDLWNRPAAVITGTTRETWGRISGALVKPQPTLEAAVAQQTCGFALRANSPLERPLERPPERPPERPLDVSLLRLSRSGRIDAIQRTWLEVAGTTNG
jgi:polar amino acid transport system substrate-binding protein